MTPNTLVFCPEALSQLGAKREGAGSYQPPLARPRYGKWPARARVKGIVAETSEHVRDLAFQGLLIR